ncbi:MAG TPA: heat-inducible transcriptional repressor HrcA [Gemmatimonadales bacterium]|nr:heat-inducible transcriptional repressor HrcA [Gemmatimonadales bacterium]
MPELESLTERERRVLEAVIETYIATAEPAGSQTVSRRSALGLSPASIRSTMGDLESKGFLYHPHTSAGRIPTDRAYRLYVDRIVRHRPPDSHSREALAAELSLSAIESDELLRRAAQVLGILTQELGVAVAPALDAIVLERFDLVAVSSERLLLVFNLKSGAVRTIYVRLQGRVDPAHVDEVQRLLNERLAGLTLREVRHTITDRLRDHSATAEAAELLDIVLAEGDGMFDIQQGSEPVMLGSAVPLVEQPEFASSERLRSVIDLTERHDLLRDALASRRESGLSITIGAEHGDPGLTGFTLVTSTYRRGGATGVIGVLGPTRMPYDKIIGLVEHTGRLVEGLLE